MGGSIIDTGVEGLNPTRRYKWFRPRQAMLGNISTPNSNDNPTVTLYNNSTGPHILVVREWWAYNMNNGTGGSGFFYLQGKHGTNGGVTQTMVFGAALLPGILTSYDAAGSEGSYYWVSQLQTGPIAWWTHDYPFAVLMPNQSLVFQMIQAGGANIALSLVWEAINEEELDYLF